MAKKRLFNNRPVCFAAFFLTLGIIAVECIYPANRLYRLIPLILSIALSAGFLVFKRTRKLTYLAVFFLIGMLAMSGATDVYSSREFNAYGTVATATVASEIVVEDGKTSFYAEDVTAAGKKLDGKTYVTLISSVEPDYGAGDKVEIRGDLHFFEHNRFDTYFAWSTNKRTYYYFYADGVTKQSDGKLSFPTNVQLAVKQMFYENTDEATASICQALVLGDKRGMDESLYEDVQTSGLAHVLAVSGLHITALATALFWLLKKLRLNPKLSFGIVLALTFFYVILCSFTASALRAFVMTALVNFASAFGLKKDNLSSLSAAAVILLLVNPANIMDVGFLLSVFAVLGLFLYYRPIYALGMKLVNKLSPEKHRGRSIAAGVATSLSTNVLTTPLVAYFFSSVPVLFILSNLIILPYLMFIWLILLFITLFALITTLWGVVGVMQYLLLPFRVWIGLVGSVSFASVALTVSVLLVIWWIVGAVLCSRNVFLTARKKTGILAGWSAVCAAVLPVVMLVSGV